MNSSTPKRIIVSSPNSSGRWSTSKKKCVESETGLSVLARLEIRPSIIGLEPSLIPDGPNPGDVIELSGYPGSGKTLLMLHLMLSVLLPSTWRGVRLKGCGGGVIFVDTDMHFNILQLENMLQKRVSIILKHCKSVLKGKCAGVDEKDVIYSAEEVGEFLRSSKQSISEELNKLTKQCLKNFFYLKCSDSTQFAVTLLSMNELFQNNGNVSLVVIDSISAFYSYDRSYRGESQYKLEQFYNKSFKVFLNYIKKHKLVLIASRQSLFQKKRRKNKDSYYGYSFIKNIPLGEEASEEACEYEYMGKEWANNVTCRICLSIIQCPVLAIADVVNGENYAESSTSFRKEVEECQTNGTKARVSLPKVINDRTKYSAEVTDKERKATFVFTVHEEGVRWMV